jgi:spermidine/putrescine transport system permease protein
VPPVLFVGILLLLPVAFIALYSVGLRTNIPGVPTPFSLSDWKDFLVGGGSAFRGRFVYSMEIALLVSVLTTLAAYPLAYFLSFVARRRRYALLLVLLAPFFTSYLLRVIAWQIILNNDGVVNSLLWTLHLRPRGSAISWLIYSNFWSPSSSSTPGSRSCRCRSSWSWRTWITGCRRRPRTSGRAGRRHSGGSRCR